MKILKSSKLSLKRSRRLNKTIACERKRKLRKKIGMNTMNQFHFTDWSILRLRKVKNAIRLLDIMMAARIGFIVDFDFLKQKKTLYNSNLFFNQKNETTQLPFRASFNVELIIFISLSIFLDQFSTSPNSYLTDFKNLND